jgi:hypothetical protein
VADLTVDPKKLDVAEYLVAMDVATVEGGALRTAAPAEFATMVKRTSGDQLKALDASPMRERVLETIFGRMGEAFRPDKLSSSRTSLVRWHVGGEAESVYETELSPTGCAVTEGTSGSEPRATMTVTFPEFLKLASGNANAPMMFMTRKLKLGGDIGFASNLTNLFDIPRS